MNGKQSSIFLLIFMLIWCGGYRASAPSSSLSQAKIELDSMFSGLDKTRVPTGYLWDVAVNMV